MTTNAHTPVFGGTSYGEARSVSCAAPDCHWISYAGVLPEAFYAEYFARNHAVQYEPGRAPDVEIDWILNVNCTVCEDYGDVKVNDDSEGLICLECRTTWSMSGELGERDAEVVAA